MIVQSQKYSIKSDTNIRTRSHQNMITWGNPRAFVLIYRQFTNGKAKYIRARRMKNISLQQYFFILTLLKIIQCNLIYKLYNGVIAAWKAIHLLHYYRCFSMDANDYGNRCRRSRRLLHAGGAAQYALCAPIFTGIAPRLFAFRWDAIFWCNLIIGSVLLRCCFIASALRIVIRWETQKCALRSGVV